MSELPESETDDARDIDHGELARPSPKHMAPGPLPAADKKVLMGVLAAAAALAVTIFAVMR
jgi:hypothetical protein